MDKYHTIRGICQGTGLLSGYKKALSMLGMGILYFSTYFFLLQVSICPFFRHI